MTDPTADEARTLLHSTTTVAAALRAAGQNRHAQWLVGMAGATFMYLVALGTTAEDADIIIVSGGFGVTAAALSIALLPGAEVAKAGMTRRWLWSMLAWGALFGASMTVGLLVFRGEPGFWLPAALVAALPLAVGGYREGRA